MEGAAVRQVWQKRQTHLWQKRQTHRTGALGGVRRVVS